MDTKCHFTISSRRYLWMLILFAISLHISAQENNIDRCLKLFSPGYIPDGQEYYTELNKEDNIGEFHATFFEGSTYRITYCSNLSNNFISLKLFDSEKNLLYSNADHNFSPYWDFTFRSTTDCIIEIKLLPDKYNSAQISILIALKKN